MIVDDDLSLAPVPAHARSRKDLGRRLAAAAVLAPSVLLFAWAGGLVFGLLCLLVALIVFIEWHRVARGGPRDAPFWLGAAGIAATAVAALFVNVPAAVSVLALAAAAVLVLERRAGQTPWLAVGIVYAGSLALSGPLLRADPALGFAVVLWLFLVVWSTDTAGYFVGRAFGGPKLSPRISPNKTWSGALGGFGAAILVTIAFAAASGLDALGPLALLAGVVSAISQVGDLLESAFKRRFRVKDVSRLIPGHGGMMDRVDGLILAAAFLALLGLARDGGGVAEGVLLW